MKICFVTAGSVNAYWEKEKHEECDVLVFGFGGLGEVDYRAELAGETSRLEDLALLSREMGCVAVSGCITDSCGMRRKSAAVAEKGRILGVADMLHAEGDFKAGAHLKVYETGAGKLGLCVGEDIFYPSVCESLALFDADAVIGVFGAAEDFAPQLMLRACAFCAGVPACMCGAGFAQVASPEGEICYRSAKEESVCDLSLRREYRLASVRTRWQRRHGRRDY